MFDNNPKYKKFTEDVANFLQSIRESEDKVAEGKLPPWLKKNGKKNGKNGDDDDDDDKEVKEQDDEDDMIEVISKYICDTKNLSRDSFGWIERILRNKIEKNKEISRSPFLVFILST